MNVPFIDIKRGNYISRVWFLHKRDAAFDVLAVLRRELPNGLWQFDYRFRYHKDDEAHDSDDEKSIWRASFDEVMDEAAAVRKVGPAIQKLKIMTRFDVDVVRIESDDPKVVLHQLSSQPWSFVKVVEREN